MTSISNNSSMISSRSSSPPPHVGSVGRTGISTPMSATSARSTSAFSVFSTSSPSNKPKRKFSNQNSAASLAKVIDNTEDNESMLGYLDQMSQIPNSTASPSPLLLPLSTKFKSQKLLNTSTPQFQSTLKEIRTLKNQAPTKETLRRVAQEIKDKKIISKLAQLHLDVVEQRRKEAKEQGVTFSEFGATGKVATDDDGNDETLEFIEQVVKRLSEHLEFTKVELFKKVEIITTTDEDIFVDNFKKNVVEKLEKKHNSSSIIKTDEEIQRFFDEQINLVFKFWQQEFVLRLKSSLQLKKEQEMDFNKENHDSNLIGIDKYRKLQVENQVLNSLVEKRDKMLEEQRTEYFKEILCLKEELTKLNYQYVPPSYFPENFDAVLTLSFLDDENIKDFNQVLLQTKNALNDRENDIRNLLNSINLFQADTFEKLKKHSQASPNLIEKLMETASAFKFKAQKLYGDNNIPHDQYQSLLEKALQLEKENEKIKNELSALQNIQKAHLMIATEELTAPINPTNALSMNKSGSATERSPGSVDVEDDDDTISVTSSISTTITNFTTTTSQAPYNNPNMSVSIANAGEGEESTVISNPIVSQLKKQLRSKEKRITKLTTLLDDAQAKINDFEDPEKIKESIMKPLRKYKAYRELIVALETETFILQKDLDKGFMREDDLIRTKNNLLFKVEDLSTRLRELNEWKDEYQRNYVDKTQDYIREIERLKVDMADKDDLLTVQESHIRDLSNENIKLNTEITKLLSKISYLRNEITDLHADIEERSKIPVVIPTPEPIIEKVIERVETIVERFIPPPVSRSDSSVQTDFPKTIFKEMRADELDQEIELTISTDNPTLSIGSFDQTSKLSSRKSTSPISSRSTIENNPISSRNPSTNLSALKSLKVDDKLKPSTNTSKSTISTSRSDTSSSRSTNSSQDITIPSPNIIPETIEIPKPPEETPKQTIEIDENDPDYDFHKFKTKLLMEEEARLKEEQLQKEKEAEANKKTKNNSNRSSRTNSKANSRTNSRASSRNTNSRPSSRNSTTSSTPPLTVDPPKVEEILNESTSPATPLNEDTSVLLDATNDEIEEESTIDPRSSSPDKRQRLASLEYSRGDNDLTQMIHQARRKSIEDAEAAKLLVTETEENPPSISINDGEKQIVEEETLDTSTDSQIEHTEDNVHMFKPERKSVKFSPLLDDNNVNIQTIRPRRRLGTMTLIERLLISNEGKELREHGYNDYYYDENGNLVLKKAANNANNGDGDDATNSNGENGKGEKPTKPTSTKLSVVISKNRRQSESHKNNYKYKMDEELTEEFIRNMDPSHPLYRKFYDENGNLIYDFSNPNNSLVNFLNNANGDTDPNGSNSRLSPTWNNGSFNGRNNAHGFSNNLTRRNRGNSRILGENDGFGDLYIGKNPTDGTDANHMVHTRTLFSDGSTKNYNNGNRRSNSSSGSRPNSSQGLTPGASLTITTPTLFKSLGQHIELSNSSKQKRLEALMKEEQDRLEKVLTSWNQMSRGHPDSIVKMKEELLQQLEEEETSYYYDLKQQTRSLSPSKKEHIIEREFNTIKYTPQNISELISELGNESKVGLDSEYTDSDSDEEDYENITATDYLMRPLLKIKGYPSTTKKATSEQPQPQPQTQQTQPTDDSLLYDINALGQLDKLNTTTTTNNSIMNISGINLINIHERNSFNSITPASSASPTHLVSAPVIPKFGVKGRKPSSASTSNETQPQPQIHRIPSIVTHRSKSMATSIDEKPRPSTTATSRRLNKVGFRSESAMDNLEHVRKVRR